MDELIDNHSTYANPDKVQPLTLEQLKKAAAKITVGSTGTGKKKGFFERLMNRFGWYRSSEWYILSTDRFNNWPSSLSEPPKVTPPDTI